MELVLVFDGTLMPFSITEEGSKRSLLSEYQHAESLSHAKLECAELEYGMAYAVSLSFITSESVMKFSIYMTSGFWVTGSLYSTVVDICDLLVHAGVPSSSSSRSK